MKAATPLALQQWHQFIESKDFNTLNDLLAEDAVFHSPVVWTPQKGKQITAMYLFAAVNLLASGSKFEYNRTVIDGNHYVLEFTTKIDGISINGIDFITINEKQKIIDFKVMIRPLKAIQLIHEKMAAALLSR